jgi:hypothetical protein
VRGQKCCVGTRRATRRCRPHSQTAEADLHFWIDLKRRSLNKQQAAGARPKRRRAQRSGCRGSASPCGSGSRRFAPGVAPVTASIHHRQLASPPVWVTIPVASGVAAATVSSVRAYSVPRPASGGAMLTLLRVRRVARLRRRPELNGASRPLRRAGSWQPSFFRAIRDFTNHALNEVTLVVARDSNLQTTNLGVGSSNLTGRAR